MTVNGNSNRFSTLQAGDLNDINATITGGGNQLALAQIGDSNTMTTSQTGGSNNSIGLIQTGSFNVANISQ